MSTMNEILKSIGGEIRKAQNHMFSRKFTEALSIVTVLDKLLEEGLAIDANNVQIKTYTNQIAKLRKDLEQKMPQADPTTSGAVAEKPVSPSATIGEASVDPLRPATPMPSAAKSASGLPAGVEKRLRDMNQLIARGKKRDAIGCFREIESSYGGQFDTAHPGYVEMKQWVETTLAEIAAEESSTQAEKERLERERVERERMSNEWEERFRDLRPFGNRTSETQDLLDQEQAFEAAKQTLAEYRSIDFTFGKTYGLEQIEQKIADSVQSFPDFITMVRQSLFDEVVKHIKSRREQLDKVLEGKPAFMSDGSIAQTEKFIGQYSPLFSEGSSEFTTISGLFRDLLDRNEINKKERQKLIFIREDLYRGADADTIKSRIEQFILAADPEARIIKTCVYKDEWKELSQWEDYAGNKRFVTRGEIHGQTIARIKGVPKLFTVYITKEKKSDGTWSNLTGNVMFSDDIAEENLP